MPAPPVAVRAHLFPLFVPRPAAPGGAAPPPPPDASTPSGRARRHYRERERCGPHIRALSNSRLYQLRVHCPKLAALTGHGMIHCGLFPFLPDAKRAREKLLAAVDGDTPLAVWLAVAKLQAAGAIPTGRRGPILPHFVRRAGDLFVARVARGGVATETRPLPTPEAAHSALWAVLTADSRARRAAPQSGPVPNVIVGGA